MQLAQDGSYAPPSSEAPEKVKMCVSKIFKVGGGRIVTIANIELVGQINTLGLHH